MTMERRNEDDGDGSPHKPKLRDKSRSRSRHQPKEQQHSSAAVTGTKHNESKSNSKRRARDGEQHIPVQQQDEGSVIVSLGSSVEFHHSSQNLLYNDSNNNNNKSMLSIPSASISPSKKAAAAIPSSKHRRAKSDDGGGSKSKLLLSSSHSCSRKPQSSSSSRQPSKSKRTDAASSLSKDHKKPITKRKLPSSSSSSSKQQSKKEEDKSTSHRDESRPKSGKKHSSASGDTVIKESKSNSASSKSRGRKTTTTTKTTSRSKSQKASKSRSRSSSRQHRSNTKPSTKQQQRSSNKTKTTTNSSKHRSSSKTKSKTTSSKPSPIKSSSRKSKKPSSTTVNKKSSTSLQHDTTTTTTTTNNKVECSSSSPQKDQNESFDHSLLSSQNSSSQNYVISSGDEESSTSFIVPEGVGLGGSQSLLDDNYNPSLFQREDDSDVSEEEEESILLLDPMTAATTTTTRAASPVDLSQQASSLLQQETSFRTTDFDVDGPSESRPSFANSNSKNTNKQKSKHQNENSLLTSEHNNNNMSNEQRVWIGIRQVLQDVDETDTYATTGFLPGDILQAMKDSTHSGGTSTIMTSAIPPKAKTTTTTALCQLQKQLSCNTNSVSDVPSIAEDSVVESELEASEVDEKEDSTTSSGESDSDAEAVSDGETDTEDDSGHEDCALRKEMCGGVGNNTTSKAAGALDMPPPLDDPTICSVETDMQSTPSTNSNSEKSGAVAIIQQKSRQEEAFKGFFNLLASASAKKVDSSGDGSDGDMPPLANSSFSSILTDLQSRLALDDGKEVVQEDKTDALKTFINYLATDNSRTSVNNQAGDFAPDGDMPPLANSSFSSILTDLQSRFGDGKVIDKEGLQDDALRGFFDVIAAASYGVPEEHNHPEEGVTASTEVSKSDDVHMESTKNYAADLGTPSLAKEDGLKTKAYPDRTKSFLELLTVMMEGSDDLPELADKLLSGDSISYHKDTENEAVVSSEEEKPKNSNGSVVQQHSAKELAKFEYKMKPKGGKESTKESSGHENRPKMGRSRDSRFTEEITMTNGKAVSGNENRRKGRPSAKNEESGLKRGDKSIETQSTKAKEPSRSMNQQGKKIRPESPDEATRNLRKQKLGFRQRDGLSGNKDDSQQKGETRSKRGMIDKDTPLDVSSSRRSPVNKPGIKGPYQGDVKKSSLKQCNSGPNASSDEPKQGFNELQRQEYDNTKLPETAADYGYDRFIKGPKEGQSEQIESYGYNENPELDYSKNDELKGHNEESPAVIYGYNEELPQPVTDSTDQVVYNEMLPAPEANSYGVRDDQDPFGLNELTCEEEPYEPYSFKDDPYAAARGESYGESKKNDHGYNRELDFEDNELVNGKHYQTMPHGPTKQCLNKPGKRKKRSKKKKGAGDEEDAIPPTSTHSNESHESFEEVNTVIAVESLPGFFQSSKSEVEREKNRERRGKGLGRSLSSFLAPRSFLAPADKSNKKRYKETRPARLVHLRKKIPFLKNNRNEKVADIVDTGCRDAQFYPGYLEMEEEEASVGALLSW